MSRSAPLGVYVHVPFCQRRCGYCDFNTYTAAELGGPSALTGFADHAIGEMALAKQELAVIRAYKLPPVDTVFFGGGTPTVLPALDLARLLRAVKETFGLAQGAEITIEANPETVDAAVLMALADAGFTRVSFGMQSSSPAVLAKLQRRHRPDQVALVSNWARQAGLDVSVDLIYGAPGESLAEWRSSLQAATDLGIDHISCYGLTIEPETPLGRKVAAGLVGATDQDEQAVKYELADQVLSQAGLRWYEISNWAKPGHECRHNLGYWRGGQWLGIGPGAHGSIGRRRYWNLKHPKVYAQTLEAEQLPVEGQENIDDQAAQLERIMLGLRLAEGLPKEVLGVDPATGAQDDAASRSGLDGIEQLVSEGLLEDLGDQIRLTLRGRLLADLVTRALIA
ncbi:MAG: radical SAM family heme chaperone HemW [Micrococcales bacterium]|nr:radical SAM family heme chaperone HemW [Micrococcales bacterium]